MAIYNCNFTSSQSKNNASNFGKPAFKKTPQFDVVYDYFLQFQLRYYLLISIIFLVHIATKSDEFLSDKEKHLSQENNICSPPSSQQHCSPYYPKPPSRCGSHSESLNGSSSGKPFNSIIYLKMISIWESKCFLYILKAKCLLCDSRRQKICSESDSKKKSELSVFVKNGVEGFFSTWYTYYIICAYFEIGFFYTDLRSSFWHSEELHKIIFSSSQFQCRIWEYICIGSYICSRRL